MYDTKGFVKNHIKGLSRRVVVLSGVVLLLVFGFLFYQRTVTTGEKSGPTDGLTTATQSAEPQAPLVQILHPQSREFSFSISLPANVSPWQLVTMYGKVSGYTTSMKFRVGDTVKTGEVMAVIDAPELKENFKKAQEQYRIKALTHKRLMGAWTENPEAIAKQDLDMAAAQAQAAEHLMRSQRDLLDYTNIRAPFTGTVTGRFADPGILIQAATGNSAQAVPVYTLMDFSTLRVFVSVPQEVPWWITPGFPVTLTSRDLEGWKLDSAVTRTTKALDSETKTLLVEIDLPNEKEMLMPGSLLTATFHFKSHPNAMAIPSQAIDQTDQNTSPAVFVVKDGQAHRMAIKTGLKEGNWTEVMEGLTGKEDVIVNRESVTEGQRVQTEIYSMPSKEA